MKLSTQERLCYVNSVLSKHNILAGVENLGLADCNKYYVSFMTSTAACAFNTPQHNGYLHLDRGWGNGV